MSKRRNTTQFLRENGRFLSWLSIGIRESHFSSIYERVGSIVSPPSRLLPFSLIVRFHSAFCVRIQSPLLTGMPRNCGLCGRSCEDRFTKTYPPNSMPDRQRDWIERLGYSTNLTARVLAQHRLARATQPVLWSYRHFSSQENTRPPDVRPSISS